jgi:uncharacterized lipoprotein YddW (UPF0748 family)
MTPEPRPPREGPCGRPTADEPAGPTSRPASAAEAELAAGARRAPARFAEVRGLWVVRFALANRASARAVVERASRAGFNTLLVQVRGRGDAYYASALEPRGAALTGGSGFDPLAEIVHAAHARGMAVHAWMNVALVADATTAPSDPRHLVRGHPEALMVPRALAHELARLRPTDPRYVARLIEWTSANKSRVEGLYAAPWSPAVRERTVAVAVDLVRRYDLDGIHFDYIRYPGADFDYSAGSLEAFRTWAAPQLDADRRLRLDRAAALEPTAWADSLPSPWADFRREQVTTLLERAYVALKTLRPWLVVSAAVHPDPDGARQRRLQDWPEWARAGLLDAVAPMAYAEDELGFREQMERALAAAGATEVWAGIGTYLAGVPGTGKQIDAARQLGAHGIVLFSYDWVVGPAGGGAASLERIGRGLRAR